MSAAPRGWPSAVALRPKPGPARPPQAFGDNSISPSLPGRPGAVSSSWLVNKPDAVTQRPNGEWNGSSHLSSPVRCWRQKAGFGVRRRNGPQGLLPPQHTPERPPFKLDIQKPRLEFQFCHSTCRVTLGKSESQRLGPRRHIDKNSHNTCLTLKNVVACKQEV